MKVGRNDPCPCGSGKKYKSCHMTEDQERSRQEQQITTLPEWLAFHTAELHRGVRQRAETEEAVNLAAAAFGLDPAPTLEDPFFAQHAMYDVQVEGQVLVARPPEGEDEAKAARRRTLATALARSYVSLHEVVVCKRGNGVRLKDRLTGAERFVQDAALADQLEPLEVVLGRVVVFEERPMLLQGWQKVHFRGRKAVIRDLDAALVEAGHAAEDAAARAAWLKREAPRLYVRVREAEPR